LLGGRYHAKAQDIYCKLYKVDIVTKITLPSLALTIFRKEFDSPDKHPFWIPQVKEDQFIRHGYYGGHADVYIPRGEDLYYYDVNSLYPLVMNNLTMPIGKPGRGFT
jgi:hypothetical protein